MDRPDRALDLARRIAEGELSRTDGALAILTFVHEEASVARDAMSAALMRVWHGKEAA
jgi:hypothetical protein